MSEVAIVGHGWVGRAMHRLFPDAYVYDVDRGTRQEVNRRDVAFVCVPTPNRPDGSLDTSIVEEVVGWCECPLIVIRSTVNPGTCDGLALRFAKRLCHQPEYLGESVAHPLGDPRTRQWLIVGGEPEDRRALIELYQTVYNASVAIRQMDNYTAEVVKLAENTYIAHALGYWQQLYDACQAAAIDFYEVREALCDDPRFSRWWSFVYPERRGMQSKCLPKDPLAFCAWAESVGASASITRAILERNRVWVGESACRVVSDAAPADAEIELVEAS